MRTLLSFLFLCLLSTLALGAGDDESRSFKNENVGKVTLVAPKELETC